MNFLDEPAQSAEEAQQSFFHSATTRASPWAAAPPRRQPAPAHEPTAANAAPRRMANLSTPTAQRTYLWYSARHLLCRPCWIEDLKSPGNGGRDTDVGLEDATAFQSSTKRRPTHDPGNPTRAATPTQSRRRPATRPQIGPTHGRKIKLLRREGGRYSFYRHLQGRCSLPLARPLPLSRRRQRAPAKPSFAPCPKCGFLTRSARLDGKCRRPVLPRANQRLQRTKTRFCAASAATRFPAGPTQAIGGAVMAWEHTEDIYKSGVKSLLTRAQFDVLLYLAHRVHPRQHFAWPERKEICAELQLSKSAVDDAIGSLAAARLPAHPPPRLRPPQLLDPVDPGAGPWLSAPPRHTSAGHATKPALPNCATPSAGRCAR